MKRERGGIYNIYTYTDWQFRLDMKEQVSDGAFGFRGAMETNKPLVYCGR